MPVAALVALTVVQAGMSIYSGSQANAAAKQEAKLQEQQGQIAREEAQINAQNEAFNQTQAVQRQRLAFLANGVAVEGSPAMVLQQSKEYGQQQVDSILKQGAARQSLANQGAQITKNKGRTALIGGYMGAIKSVAGAATSAYAAGAFDPSAQSQMANAPTADFRS